MTMRTAIPVLFIAGMLALAGTPTSAQGEPAIRPKAETCFACHGPNGNSENPVYPILAGQSWRYIYVQLKDFKAGRRAHPAISPTVADLTREDMIALGNFFAAQKPQPIPFKADGSKVDAGRRISDAVLCPMCHNNGFGGQNEIPKVAGQYPEYIRKQLHDFKARRRTNDAGNMTSVAGALSDDEIESLSHYIANLN